MVRCSARPFPAAVAVLSLLLALGSGRAAAAPADRGRPPANLVVLELLADSTHVTAGRTLTLAARLAIAPGWHIYWENPGEAGLATEVAFSAPAGYRVGPVRYPGPDRFQSPGETAASYGYSGDALLSSTVEVPAQAGSVREGKAGEPLRFSVAASWLACRDVCIRGQARASIDLPRATRSQPSRPANTELFERHRAELPRRMAELGAASRWERDRGEVRLLLAVKRADRIEYFPPGGEDFQLASQAATAGKSGETELRLVYKSAFKPAHARGILAVTRGSDKRYYALDLEETQTR